MPRPCWRLLALLKLLLLAQPIFAHMAPREPLAALQGRRLFGPAAPVVASADAQPPQNRVDAAAVHAAVDKFVELLYDAAALTPRASEAHPRPLPISAAAVAAAAHREALAVLTHHARAHPHHPFHSPKPLLPPAFHGDACAALLVARGLAHTAGNARAAALLLGSFQAACPAGYAADFSASVCAARPALRATTFCADAERATGDWPYWAKITTCAVGASAVVAAGAVAASVAAGRGVVEASLPAAYDGEATLGAGDLYGLQQALLSNGLGVAYGTTGVLVSGSLM